MLSAAMSCAGPACAPASALHASLCSARVPPLSNRRGVRALNPPLERLAAVDAAAERDADVEAEERRMRDLLHHRSGSAASLALQQDSANAVEVYGLQKVFAGGCCGGRGCRGVFW